MNKTSLVIGGTGFIGSNLVRYLADKGEEVIVFHRPESDLANLDNIPFKSATGDFTNKQDIERSLLKAMEGCRIVYNLAVFSSFLKKRYPLMEAINTEAAGIVARVAKKAGIGRLIHVSSSAAVGYPEGGRIADEDFIFNADFDHYAVTKRRGEELVLHEAESGLDAVIAIPCSTVGARGMKLEQRRVFKDIIAGKMQVYPSGGLCLTNVGDLVKGLYLCSEKAKAGKRYILGGCNIKYKDYFAEIARCAGVKPPGIVLPGLIMPWLGLGVEFASYLSKKETGINRNVAIMVSRDLYYSFGLASRELDYRITDWRETIRNTVENLVADKTVAYV